ncbi:MAG: hypothetical protein ABI832_09370 [bacterium]
MTKLVACLLSEPVLSVLEAIRANASSSTMPSTQHVARRADPAALENAMTDRVSNTAGEVLAQGARHQQSYSYGGIDRTVRAKAVLTRLAGQLLLGSADAVEKAKAGTLISPDVVRARRLLGEASAQVIHLDRVIAHVASKG